MRILSQQFDSQITHRGLRQLWIWARRPDGARLEVRWIGDSIFEACEPNDVERSEIEACLQAMESAA